MASAKKLDKKKFNISDADLHKACINNDVPLPGYWQKIRVGKNVPSTELLTDYSDENGSVSPKEGLEEKLVQSPFTLIQFTSHIALTLLQFISIFGLTLLQITSLSSLN